MRCPPIQRTLSSSVWPATSTRPATMFLEHTTTQAAFGMILLTHRTQRRQPRPLLTIVVAAAGRSRCGRVGFRAAAALVFAVTLHHFPVFVLGNIVYKSLHISWNCGCFPNHGRDLPGPQGGTVLVRATRAEFASSATFPCPAGPGGRTRGSKQPKYVGLLQDKMSKVCVCVAAH